MRSLMLTKFSSRFLLSVASFLMFFNPSVSKAQNNSTEKCETKRVTEYEYVYEFNVLTGKRERVRKLVSKWKLVCEGVPVQINSTTSGGGNSNVEIKPNGGLRAPYAGQYKGTWFQQNSSLGEQKGEWTLSIGKNGKVSGKELNTTYDATGNFNGFINEDGLIEISLQYGGRFASSPPHKIKGYVTNNNENRHLKGTLTDSADGGTFEIDLKPISIDAPTSNVVRSEEENRQLALTFSSKAENLMEEKKYLEAIESYTEAINVYPQNATDYLGRGNAKFKSRDYRAAIADYDQAIRIYSDWETEEKTRKANGGTGLSFKEFAVSSEYPKAFHNRGLAKKLLGDADGSSADFRRACSLGVKEDC